MVKKRRIKESIVAMRDKNDFLQKKKELQLKNINKNSEIISHLHIHNKKHDYKDLISTYQNVSRRHESKFSTSKWLIKILKEENDMNKIPKISLLDVGALRENYKIFSGLINVRYIDLHSTNPNIESLNILDLDNQKNSFDLVCLSLVLNFSGSSHERGRILKHAASLSEKYLFIVLPKSCVDNSRYLTFELFLEMLKSLIFFPLRVHRSSKLIYFLFEKKNLTQNELANVNFIKKLRKNGGGLNNYCIVL